MKKSIQFNPALNFLDEEDIRPRQHIWGCHFYKDRMQTARQPLTGNENLRVLQTEAEIYSGKFPEESNSIILFLQARIKFHSL